jgi:YfiH family protein
MRWKSDGDVRWLEADLPRARVCFSSRVGGVSAAPYDSLNLGILTGDQRSAVLENRRRLASTLGIAPETVAMGRQVHGSRIAVHGPGPVSGAFAEPVPDPDEVDGHVTKEMGLPMLVLVADCLPVAVSGPGGLAVLHCGWRGLAGTLVEDAVRLVEGDAAVIGPGIGRCCFEVGEEVLDAFSDLGEGVADGRMCDLPEVARLKLEGAGVRQVELSGVCSSCEPDLFFSHRRDAGSTGRQAGVAWLVE